MEGVDDPADRVTAEIDRHVAAHDEIDRTRAERFAPRHQVVLAPIDKIPQLFADPPGGAQRREETVQVVALHRRHRPGPVASLPGSGQGIEADVGSEHLQVPAGAIGHQAGEDHRQGVSLLARGTAGAPDAQLPTPRPGPLDKIGQDDRVERPQLRR